MARRRPDQRKLYVWEVRQRFLVPENLLAHMTVAVDSPQRRPPELPRAAANSPDRWCPDRPNDAVRRAREETGGSDGDPMRVRSGMRRGAPLLLGHRVADPSREVSVVLNASRPSHQRCSVVDLGAARPPAACPRPRAGCNGESSPAAGGPRAPRRAQGQTPAGPSRSGACVAACAETA
jgi:hypothetical protein